MKAFVYKARFTEEWLKQQPSDRGREIVARPTRGDDRYVMVKKLGATSFQSYSKEFVELSTEKYEEEK